VPLVKGERRLLDVNCFPVSTFTFSPDSRRVLAVHNQMATVWDVDTGQQLARLPPHASAFLAGRFAPDGRKVYLTCFDHNIYAWDIGTNSLSPLFRGSDYQQTTLGNCLAISSDGTRLYQGSGDYQRDGNAQPIKQGDDYLYHDVLVRIIDVATGKEVGRFTGHTSSVHTIDVSANGRRALSASEDSVCLWDAQTGKLIRRLAENAVGKGNTWLEGHLAADGRTALLKLRDANLRVWDVDNDRELRTFGTPDARLQALALSPDGTRALTSTYVQGNPNQQPGPGDITIHLWDVATGKELRRFEGHTHFVVNPLAISPDDRLGVSGSWDKTVRVWDLSGDAPAGAGAAANPPDKGPGVPAPEGAAGARTKQLLGHEGAVTALAGSQDGRRLLSGDTEGSVRLWDVEKGAQLIQLDGARGEIRAVALSPDGHFAAAAGTEGMWCWDTTTGQVVPTVKEDKPMGGVFFSADGQRLVVAGTEGSIHSFVMDGKRFDWGMTARHLGIIRCLAAVPGTELCVYVPKDDTIHVYDLNTRKDVRQLPEKFTSVTVVACAPDGRQVAGIVGTAVQFWHPQTGAREEQFLRHNVRATGVAYSPDGRYVLTGCEDKVGRLWDVKTGLRQAELSGHQGPVTSVAFSGDGRFAFTGGGDKAIMAWPLPKPGGAH
jgi:WD40 repeat protein